MNPTQAYLLDLRAIRASGSAVEETSYYGALERLFNEVGKRLKPKVRCIINIKNTGAGIPDGGFFTSDQLQENPEAILLAGQVPARGCIEVKGTGENIETTIKGKQVKKYLSRYGQVLVTNYRDFALVKLGANDSPQLLETYSLATNEEAFWRGDINTLVQEHEERFLEYLKRALLHAAPLELPKDVAWFLASYARDAKARVEKAELPALGLIRSSLEEALGLKFTEEDGEHFFRSTLVQTLFYGVFSAWVLWNKQHPPSDTEARFDWQTAVWSLRVPMIKALYEQLAIPSRLKPLGLIEVLDWTAAALNRVNRKEFFSKFEEEQAVQYFYEPFLEAFDPELRKELGVWYTPSEVVRYMVARVDAVLREDLGLEDGLADPNVYVLDPCCGTGAYLVEVLRKIGKTLEERGEDALSSFDIKKAAMSRIFGFEILPAPFVVAHLQLGLILQQLGAPLSEEKEERVGVYLTNALTGWEPPKEPKTQLSFPELEEERTAADKVKRDTPILVVLGNPPYNAFAGVSPEEEKGLVEPYKEGLISKWGIKKFNLDDLYIRFFRLAERRICETSGKGVVCYISNFSYLGDPSYVVMRERFLNGFDSLWIDCMNGDSRETGKLTPDGKPDPSVFSTKSNREGIRLGTAIGLMIRKSQRAKKPLVRFRQFWGVNKRTDLIESLQEKNFKKQYEEAHPTELNRFSFRPLKVTEQYNAWPKLVELCEKEPISGLQEMRKGALMSLDREDLESRMRLYFDANVSWEAVQKLKTGLTENGGRFDAKETRKRLLLTEKFSSEQVFRYALYPFDLRWCYHTNARPLWNEPRPALSSQCWEGNNFLITRMFAERPHEQNVITITSALPDYHLLRPNAVAIPFRIRPVAAKKKETSQIAFFDTAKEHKEGPTANLAPSARLYLSKLGINDPDKDEETSSLIWMHALAIGYAPAYLSENGDGIRQDWPRIPLPAEKETLVASSLLGKKLASLLDTEKAVTGVTTGKIRTELRSVGAIASASGDKLHPENGDLELRAGWGHEGRAGITMPGKGKATERDYTEEERDAISKGASELGLSIEQVLAVLGATTYDVYLNNVAYWRNVPTQVWEYTIGGYQVIKKWLSYREYDLLERSLTLEEVREVMNTARRITAILLLEPVLNANYIKVTQEVYAWS